MSTTTGIGAVAGISILTALCADVGTPESFRDGYLLGAVFAALGIAASLMLRRIDYASGGSAAASAERALEGARPLKVAATPIPNDELDEEGLAPVG